MDPQQQKHRLRQSIKERMEKLKEKDRQAESRSICRRVMEHLPEGRLTVCAYYPMRTEVDIVFLLEHLLERGCDIYLPRAEGKEFEFRQMTSFDDLVPGPFGILEPPDDAQALVLEDVSFAIIPGVAFNHEGGRIGRGNGGYDKWIRQLRAENDTAEVWGVALDPQLTNAIPVEAHDEKVDALATTREFKRFVRT